MITFQHKYFPEILRGGKNESDQKEKCFFQIIEIFFKKKNTESPIFLLRQDYLKLQRDYCHQLWEENP